MTPPPAVFLRAAAVLLLVLVLVMVARDVGRQPAEEIVPARVQTPPTDARSAELMRCRDLGMAAAEDAACRRAWSRELGRFLEQPATGDDAGTGLVRP